MVCLFVLGDDPNSRYLPFNRTYGYRGGTVDLKIVFFFGGGGGGFLMIGFIGFGTITAGLTGRFFT